MFEIYSYESGEPRLRYVHRPRRSFERGVWVEIGKEDEWGVEEAVLRNRQSGYIVLLDEYYVYRALVLTE